MASRLAGSDLIVSTPVANDDAGLSATQNVVDIVIYFVDNFGLHLKVIDGQNATASELFEMVMDERGYHSDARELFSLWLVSDLLELQLKPNHVPFKLVCYWEELLEKYSSAPEYERQRDEPVIMFRRNVFCSTVVEREKFDGVDEDHSKLLILLYEEAKKNVVGGRYPAQQNVCDELAGIQAVITGFENTKPDNFGSELYFRTTSFEYLPRGYCKQKWSLLPSSSANPAIRLHSHYQRSKEEYTNPTDAMCSYLKTCHKLPYYGAAYFRGQIERPHQKLLNKRTDESVFVAINTYGVHVISVTDSILLIALPFKHVCWEYVEPSKRDSNCLPFLFLQFPATDASRRLLQIFSRQAIMMDKLIEACVKLQKSCGDSTDGLLSGLGDEVQVQFERLLLQKYPASPPVK